MTHSMAIARFLAAGCLLFTLASPARGEIFLLESGGEVRGTAVRSSQDEYVIKTGAGVELTLARSEVKRIKPESKYELEYARARTTFPDTIEGHLSLADWCHSKGLTSHQRAHLQRVLEMDPDHVEAHKGLGQRQVQGVWMSREEEMQKKGFVYYNGKWVLPQQKEIQEENKKNEAAQKRWARDVKLWLKWLGTDKEPAAIAAINGINDPQAVLVLREELLGPPGRENHAIATADRELNSMLVQALIRINTDDSLMTLAHAAMQAEDDEIETICLDALAAAQYKPAEKYFIQQLKSKENDTVNRAGGALGKAGSNSSVEPLINALVTRHKHVISKGDPNQISSSFGTGGSGNGGGGGSFGFGGGGNQVEYRDHTNAEVLASLVKITGKNFAFDVNTWKHWYAQQQKPKSLDARRD